MNFRGSLRIDLERLVGRDESANVPGGESTRLRFFATEAETGDEHEVELRVGRGGVVFAIPTAQAPAMTTQDLPADEDLHPIHPDARVTPFRVEDFTRIS